MEETGEAPAAERTRRSTEVLHSTLGLERAMRARVLHMRDLGRPFQNDHGIATRKIESDDLEYLKKEPKT